MAIDEIVAAADGSALGNPGPAGWAWYINDRCWGAGGWAHGTNNMGELKAVLDLLESTAHVPEIPLKILCDSRYTIDALTKWIHGWKKKGWKKANGQPVLNLDLFKELDTALQGRRYTFEWVKGHAGHPMNEAADERARGAATAFRDGNAPDHGPGFVIEAIAGNKSASVPSPAPSPESANVSEPISAKYSSALEAEKALYDETVYSDLELLEELLGENFSWITPAGAITERDTVLRYRSNAFATVGETEILTQEPLGDSTFRITSRVKTARVPVLRTSLWIRTHGRWVLHFRQETAVPVQER